MSKLAMKNCRCCRSQPGDPERVRAQYLYTWTGGGNPAQFVSSLECQMLSNGDAIYISHIAPADQLEAEQRAANDVIASLVLPEN